MQEDEAAAAQKREYDRSLADQKKLPSSLEAIDDFNMQLDQIAKEISAEYTRMFNGDPDEKHDPKASSPTRSNKITASSAYTSPGQLREQREQRKQQFLNDFNTTARCKMLKDKLKKSLLRLAVDKYHKTVSSSQTFSQAQRDSFKADLYCFLTEQMRVAMDLIFRHHAGDLNPDLAGAREVAAEQKRLRVERCWADEGPRQKAERLFREFDTIRDVKNAERQMLILCTQQTEDSVGDEMSLADYWEKYSRFALQHPHLHSTAEYYLRMRLDQTIQAEHHG